MKTTFNVLGTICYIIAFILILCVAPQTTYSYYGGHDTVMNIPTMFYANYAFIIGSMFYIMGFISPSSVKSEVLPDIKPNKGQEVKPQENNNGEVDTKDFTGALVAIILIVVIIAFCLWGARPS